MKSVFTLIVLLLIPTLGFAQDAEPEATQKEPQELLCLVSTSLDGGDSNTLTNVHTESQLLLGQRGSVKLTVQYETRTEAAGCQELTLELPTEGAPGTATLKVGKSAQMTVDEASVMSHTSGRLVLIGNSLTTERSGGTPVSRRAKRSKDRKS